MTPSTPTPVLAYSERPPTVLDVFRRVSAETDCPYPYLAATRDRSTSLLVGHYQACFELVPSGETRRWLPDFAATRSRLSFDLAGLRELVQHVFPDRVDCGIIQFDAELRVSELQLVLVDEEGEVEYAIRAFGRYERAGLAPGAPHRVSAAETALLHVCCAMGAVLARRAPELLREPPERAGVGLAKGEDRVLRAAARSR